MNKNAPLITLVNRDGSLILLDAVSASSATKLLDTWRNNIKAEKSALKLVGTKFILIRKNFLDLKKKYHKKMKILLENWYKPEIDKKQLKELSKRKDLPALNHFFIYFCAFPFSKFAFGI
mgnify:CR=1 FL=1